MLMNVTLKCRDAYNQFPLRILLITARIKNIEEHHVWQKPL